MMPPGLVRLNVIGGLGERQTGYRQYWPDQHGIWQSLDYLAEVCEIEGFQYASANCEYWNGTEWVRQWELTID